MYFSDVRIRNYRNLEKVDVDLSKGINLFIGDNGQGKSNFIEALFYSTQGTSFRPIDKESLINKSEPEVALVKANVNHSDLESELILRLHRGKNKIVTLNGKRISKTKMIQFFPMILFSPDSLTVIKQGPDERRKLLDDFIVSTSASEGQALTDFKKCLKNRNRLLSKIADSETTSAEDLATLDSINQIYFGLCLKVSLARLNAIQKISLNLSETGNFLFQDSNVDISVNYVISGEVVSGKELSEANDTPIEIPVPDSSEILTKLLKRHDQLAAAEKATGTSLVGPHKHDIKFMFNGQDSRYFCSQGQQRALILAFKIAHVRYFQEEFQRTPILMLDDVLSELDLQRRRFLIQFLKKIEAQIFMTSTDLQMLDQFDDHIGRIFNVKSGQIKLANHQESSKNTLNSSDF